MESGIHAVCYALHIFAFCCYAGVHVGRGAWEIFLFEQTYELYDGDSTKMNAQPTLQFSNYTIRTIRCHSQRQQMVFWISWIERVLCEKSRHIICYKRKLFCSTWKRICENSFVCASNTSLTNTCFMWKIRDFFKDRKPSRKTFSS